MKKKTRKRSLCLLLAAALLLTSIPFDMTTSSKAEEKGTVVRDGEYTTGIFAGEYGIDQLFDYVMMTSTLKGLPYDASWGTANASTGHQFTKSMMTDRHFVLKYSGDSNYPLALCLYEDDGTPVVSSRNKGLKSSSKIGLSTNVCLTTTASTYMKKNYTDGIEGVMALCSMGEADSNGLYFKSKNGFGYYLSGSQGRDVGEKIVWEDDANTSVTMDELAEMTGYSSNSLESGQYAVMYNSEGGQQVLDMPEEQTKEKDVDLTLSENVPTRKGYRFIEWNTKEDGSGTSYDPGATYSKNQVVTLYAIWYRYYEEGLFGAKLSKDQILDVITSTNMINGYGYDASWGTADASTGHQFKSTQLKDRYFVFRYSGDDNYPVSLYMYEADGTPVTSSESKNLYASSLIGDENNVCLTEDGYDYMEAAYDDGIKGLVCQGEVTQYDENGVTFESINGFGYYVSINRGYKKGDYINWNEPEYGADVDELDSIDTFADAEMYDGEYAIIYNENTSDLVKDFPSTQKKEDLYAFIITTQKPTRKGYVFNGWNTKKDGSGQEYAAGSRYSGTGVLTLYATWKEEEKAALEIYENGKKVDQSYLMSNEDAVDKIVKDAKDSNEFYAKLNEINLVHTFEVKGGYAADDVYKAVASDASVASCEMNGNILTLTGKKDGFTYVTVTDETSGQIYRMSVDVKTLANKLYIIRPITDNSYKDYLTDIGKVGCNVSGGDADKVEWTTENDKAESIKQLSNGDCIVWKPAQDDVSVGVKYGLSKSDISIKDMLSGEASGAYPINNCQVSSKYMQNITLSDATGKGKESKFTIKAYLLDDKGKEIAKDTQTFEKNLVDNPYSTEVTFSNVKQLDNAEVLLEITTENNTYEPKLVRYSVFSDGQQVSGGTKVQLNSKSDGVTDNNIVYVTDENGKDINSLLIDKNETKKIVVNSCAATGHLIEIKTSGRELSAAKEETTYYDGMVNEWKKSVFEIDSKSTSTGRHSVEVIVKDSKKNILSTQTTPFTIANVTDLPSPEKPTSINFVGDLETPKLSAGKVINRTLKFNLPKVLPMKVSFQDTDDPFKKTFMIAIGNAGLDENNIVAAVTETINDLKDNKLTKTLSGYAFGNADFIDGKWVMTYTGGGIAGSIQYEFSFNNNVVVGFVPLYYGMKVGCSANIDALVSGGNSYHNQFVGLDFSTNNLKLTSQYNFVTDILVGVKGYVGASGGVGFDGKVVKLKFGVEGNLSVEYNHRVVIFKDLDKTKTYDGGYLNFSGDIGLYFEFKLLFIKYKKKIVGTGFNKGRSYRDWEKFPVGRPNLLEFAGMKTKSKSSLLKIAPKADEDWMNYINPYITPVAAEDGKSMAMVYTENLEDLGTINPAVSEYDGAKWSDPKVMTDWRTKGENQTVNAIDYAKDDKLEVLAFDAVTYDSAMENSDDISSSQFNTSANSSEIHVYVNGKHTKLTDNQAADTAPVVSVKNGKAMVVWQSDTYNLESMDESAVKDDMQGEKKLYFSFYDGTKWSDPACLESGEIKGVQAYDMDMSDDGTAMILASMGSSDLLKNRELYSYVIDNGQVKSVNRVTCNEAGETQPRVKYVTDNDGMFLTAWQQSEYKGEETSKVYVKIQGYNMSGSANDFSLDDNGEVAENFDFAKGGDTIDDSAVYWYSIGDDSLNHTYVKYINKKDSTLSTKYEMNSTSSESESMVGNTVTKEGDSFSVVSCAQPQKQSSGSDEDEEQPARLIFAKKQIKNELRNETANAFDQNIVPESNVNVTISFTNAGRKALENVTIKNNGNVVYDNYPISLKSGESGQIQFTYSLGKTLKNEEFDIEADNGAKAVAKLTLLGADLVVSNPEVTSTLSGGERVMQAVISNAGTTAMNENDSVRIDYSMADQKNVKVNPISAGAKWDSNKKQIVVSGKEAIEAVNKGEYILQFGYKPTFKDDADAIALSMNAAAYGSDGAMDELNVVDNSSSFSIIKPSKLYDTQLVCAAIIENGKIIAVKVTNQYETAIKKGIKISNGTGSKQINVALNGEESKTYPVELAVSGSIEYTLKDYNASESTAKPTATPAPTKKPAVTPVPTKKPTATKKPAATKTPAPKITVGKATIKKLKNKAKKKMVVTIKAVKGASGYKVMYATNKKFKKAKTKWTSAKKVTISRLKKGKTYYVKVIAYKKGKGAVKVFGKASKVKKVKIKK